MQNISQLSSQLLECLRFQGWGKQKQKQKQKNEHFWSSGNTVNCFKNM